VTCRMGIDCGISTVPLHGNHNFYAAESIILCEILDWTRQPLLGLGVQANANIDQ
jgi:hypothetical protein